MPELRDVSPRFEVKAPAWVRQAIKDEIRGEFSYETGGWLFSHYPPGIHSVSLSRATGLGPSSEHSATHVRLSDVEEVEAEFGAYETSPYQRCVGDWRVHPASDGIPSKHDMRSWASWLKDGSVPLRRADRHG